MKYEINLNFIFSNIYENLEDHKGKPQGPFMSIDHNLRNADLNYKNLMFFLPCIWKDLSNRL